MGKIDVPMIFALVGVLVGVYLIASGRFDKLKKAYKKDA